MGSMQDKGKGFILNFKGSGGDFKGNSIKRIIIDSVLVCGNDSKPLCKSLTIFKIHLCLRMC